MLRSIHAECYKVFHRLYFQVSALLCALFAGGMVFCLYLIKTEAGGETIITMPFAVAALLFGMVMGVYLVIIGVDMVFSDQYKFNTLKNEVSFGVGRSRIYLSRWAAALLVMALLYLILVAVYSLASLILLGLPTPEEAQAMYGVGVGRCVLNSFRTLGLYTLAALPLWLGGMSLALACYFLISNSTMAAFGYMGILVALPAILDKLGAYVNPFFTQLHHLTLIYHMNELALGELDWTKTGVCWLVGLGWTVLSTAAGLVLFGRKEIK